MYDVVSRSLSFGLERGKKWVTMVPSFSTREWNERESGERHERPTDDGGGGGIDVTLGVVGVGVGALAL